MSRILIAEDQARIASFVEKGLRGQLIDGQTLRIPMPPDETIENGNIMPPIGKVERRRPATITIGRVTARRPATARTIPPHCPAAASPAGNFAPPETGRHRSQRPLQPRIEGLTND